MFRTFQSQGPADLTLAYLTAFIAEVLRFMAKQKTKEDARKKLTELSMSQNFPIPGDKNFASAHRRHRQQHVASTVRRSSSAVQWRWRTALTDSFAFRCFCLCCSQPGWFLLQPRLPRGVRFVPPVLPSAARGDVQPPAGAGLRRAGEPEQVVDLVRKEKIHEHHVRTLILGEHTQAALQRSAVARGFTLCIFDRSPRSLAPVFYVTAPSPSKPLAANSRLSRVPTSLSRASCQREAQRRVACNLAFLLALRRSNHAIVAFFFGPQPIAVCCSAR